MNVTTLARCLGEAAGESVVVNMKPKSHDAWTGSIYSRSSGNTYCATVTLKSFGRLQVEACALGRFWCSGNDWTRIEAPREGRRAGPCGRLLPSRSCRARWRRRRPWRGRR
ncbi:MULTISPECIES: DUF2147 domain-containing protein [Bradyrhizobium]|uniref:DUF2147 domain-containing protein n=1 Tax=Bradyrhizobium TaxID=374 RepID=UPI001FDF982D|nr:MULTISPECIES: DUF2147 domain-containing protein [Bradyrhizobium]